MLLVNAKAGPSRIDRLGLIAQELIPQGTTIWTFLPGFDVAFSNDLLQRLAPAAREQAIHWSFYLPACGTYILSSDDDRFTNHADEPNCRVAGACTVAVRDIQPGEEITNNYQDLANLRIPSLTSG